MKFLIFVFLLSSCVTKYYKKQEIIAPESKLKKLEAQAKYYCELSKVHYDQKGFVGKECDSALYTALHGMMCEYITLSHFSDKGRLYRNPDFKKCEDKFFDDVMTIGFQLNQAKKQDNKLIKNIIEYNKKNNWQGIPTYMKDNWINIEKKSLGMELEIDKKRTEQFMINTGVDAFIDVTQILIEGLLYGKISENNFELLKLQAERQLGNEYFQAAYAIYNDGKVETVIDSLIRNFPNERLPTTRDRCIGFTYILDQENLRQRLCNKKMMIFEGTDFLLASWVILHAKK